MSQAEPNPLRIASLTNPVRYVLAGLFFVLLAASTPALAAGGKPAAPLLTPQARLDELFGRLAQASSPQEAQVISSSIEHIWLRSGSDTADLLMDRALTALTAKNTPLALEVLDKVIALEPDWAEAWNKRATLRYFDNDDKGSMSDIAHVLALEPRHFGALAGMAYILQRNGDDKHAMQIFRRVLEISPQQDGVRKIVEKLAPEVDGREL